MPEHVKNFNKKVGKGAIRLPEIPSYQKRGSGAKSQIRPSIKKSKRAKKLERLELDDPLLLI